MINVKQHKSNGFVEGSCVEIILIASLAGTDSGSIHASLISNRVETNKLYNLLAATKTLQFNLKTYR